MLLLQSISSTGGVGETGRLGSWQKGRRMKYSTSTYLMAQKVVICHPETHVGTTVKVVGAVKRQLPKTNLGRKTRKPYLSRSCFKHAQGPDFGLLGLPRRNHPFVPSPQCRAPEVLWIQISMWGTEVLALLIDIFLVQVTAASLIHGNSLTLHTPLESISVPPNKTDNQVEVKFTSCSGYHKHSRA